MTRPALRLAAVLEGTSDHRTVSALVQRLISGASVEIVGQDAASPFLAWGSVAKLSEGRVPRYHGHFNGEPGVEDALTATRALWLFHALRDRPTAVVLVRDSDGKPGDRRKGLEQARADRSWPFAVLIGVAHHAREAWVLAGFSPEDDDERRRLDAERKKLGFDPTTEPHRLNAAKRDGQAVRNAKRVLSFLAEDSVEREDRCVREAPLEALRSNGAAAGLSAFIDDVTAAMPSFSREV